MTIQNNQVPVRTVQDAMDLRETATVEGTNCNFRGLITKVFGRGGIIFLRLCDATGAIRLEAQRDDYSVETFDAIRKIKSGDRVIVSGTLERRKDKPDVLLIRIGTMRRILARSTAPVRINTDAVSRGINLQILLARARRGCAHYLEDRGFLEIEPNCLGIVSPLPGIEPLGVVFPGYGSPLKLIPSPSTQLFDALLLTGNEEFFCSSRCFSAAVRDGHTSAESLIISFVKLNADIDDTTKICQDAVTHALNSISPSSNLTKRILSAASLWQTEEIEGTPTWPDVSVPTTQTFNRIQSDSFHSAMSINRVFKVIWPANLNLAEGYVGLLDGQVKFSGATIHLERVVQAINYSSLRRLKQLDSVIKTLD